MFVCLLKAPPTAQGHLRAFISSNLTKFQKTFNTKQSACWVCSCFRSPSQSDMDYRIFNVIILVRAYIYTHGGWVHRQRVSTTFLTRKNPHKFILCSWRDSNRGPLDLESEALPLPPPRPQYCYRRAFHASEAGHTCIIIYSAHSTRQRGVPSCFRQLADSTDYPVTYQTSLLVSSRKVRTRWSRWWLWRRSENAG